MRARELEAIRQRAEAATPAPWAVEEARHSGFNVGNENYDLSACLCPPADASFIAHAREDVPMLLDEINSLREIISEQIYCIHCGDECGTEFVVAKGTPICADCAEEETM